MHFDDQHTYSIHTDDSLTHSVHTNWIFPNDYHFWNGLSAFDLGPCTIEWYAYNASYESSPIIFCTAAGNWTYFNGCRIKLLYKFIFSSTSWQVLVSFLNDNGKQKFPPILLSGAGKCWERLKCCHFIEK